jgi:hypothetical protein
MFGAAGPVSDTRLDALSNGGSRDRAASEIICPGALLLYPAPGLAVGKVDQADVALDASTIAGPCWLPCPPSEIVVRLDVHGAWFSRGRTQAESVDAISAWRTATGAAGGRAGSSEKASPLSPDRR